MASAAVPDDDKKGEKQHASREHVCAICLEQYRKPRGLSCLHTFCEGCIQSCILKEVEKGIQLSAIKCPVCRKDTQPVNPTKSPVEWIKDLASNIALVFPGPETVDHMERVTESELCGVCSTNPKNAHRHCKECKTNMCKTCIDVHNRLPCSSKHTLLRLEDVQDVISIDLGMVEFCDIHPDKRIKFYCEGHKSMCCSTCAIVKHRQCETVVEVKELGQSFKNGDRALPLQSKMADLHTKLQETKSTIDTNRQDVETQADTMVTRMVDMRNQIVETLDHLVTKVTDNCRQIKKEQSITVDDEISSIESLFAAIASSCSLLQSVLKHGTEKQIFIAFHKVEEQLNGYEKLVNNNWNGLTAFDLDIEMFTKLDNCVTVLKSVTDIPVRKTARKTRTIEMVNPIPEKLPLITVQKHPDMSLQSWYSGIVHLRDGQLLATDANGNNNICCLLDGCFKVTAYITLPGQPTNLAVIGPSEVVIPLHTTKQLQRVTVRSNSLTLNGTIPCQGREPKCVSRVSDTEVAVGWKEGLSIITLDGKEQMYVSKDSERRKINFSEDSRFTVDVKRSCFTHKCTNTVYCFDFTGKVKFQYKGSLTKPRGIALDRDGNVYIANWDDNNPTVHQVSPDGQVFRVISVDVTPYSLCINTEGDEMIVTDNNGIFIQRIRVGMKHD